MKIMSEAMIMAGGLMLAVTMVQAAGIGVGASAGASGNSSTGSMGSGTSRAGVGTNVNTSVDTGPASANGSLGVGVDAGINPSAGANRVNGVIDDTGRSGTSSISTQSDSAARINASGRGGTVSGRSGIGTSGVLRPSTTPASSGASGQLRGTGTISSTTY